MIRVQYLPSFARQYKKLPKEVRLLAEKRVLMFRTNPFDSRLKTHKLGGQLEHFLSFSINYSVRIIFDFAEDSKGRFARFYQIGSHDIYD